MGNIIEKFEKLGIKNAPGQEEKYDVNGKGRFEEELLGDSVDFSHGDVDAFTPIPGAKDAFITGYDEGGKQAYTKYRGREEIREYLAEHLSMFFGTMIDPQENIIITPGTQGALFLAMGSLVSGGDKVAIVEPDYFANRKIAEFLECKVVPIRIRYEENEDGAGIDFKELEEAFKDDVKLFLFSNPNNPTGVIYSEKEIYEIIELAARYNVALIVDELYSRLVYENRKYTHLCAHAGRDLNVVTIIGPSKTESLSGFRLGVAVGNREIIERMEKLQAIVSLRAAGYSQAVLKCWFQEPEGFMEERILQHQKIRDALYEELTEARGVHIRKTEAGSYLFVELPEMTIGIEQFCKILRTAANVTVTPGTEFGREFTHHFRINFSQDYSRSVDAIKRVKTVINRYRKETI